MQRAIVLAQEFGMGGVALAIQRGFVGGRLRCRPHFDAIDRTGRQAQFTPRAAIGQHGVHVLLRPDDGIDGTRRKAASTADAACFVDPGDTERRLDAVCWIQRRRGTLQQARQGIDSIRAAGRALIDLRLAIGDRRRVRAAAGITASGALGLRQQCVDARRDVRRGLAHAI